MGIKVPSLLLLLLLLNISEFLIDLPDLSLYEKVLNKVFYFKKHIIIVINIIIIIIM